MSTRRIHKKRATRVAAGRTTTQRGYGHKHQKRRHLLLTRHIEGTLCNRCHQPMYKTQGLDAGHPDDQPASQGGMADRLEHITCNRGAPNRAATPDLNQAREARQHWTTRTW